jgi:hypothetical protein
VATIIELGATARRLAPLIAHRKEGHRNTIYDFALASGYYSTPLLALRVAIFGDG